MSAAVTLDCDHLQADGQTWDLHTLGGPHSVYNAVSNNLTIHNTTYTLDVCKPLKDSQCHTGTYGKSSYLYPGPKVNRACLANFALLILSLRRRHNYPRGR